MADSIFSNGVLLLLGLWTVVITTVNIATFAVELFHRPPVHVPHGTSLKRYGSPTEFPRQFT